MIRSGQTRVAHQLCSGEVPIWSNRWLQDCSLVCSPFLSIRICWSKHQVTETYRFHLLSHGLDCSKTHSTYDKKPETSHSHTHVMYNLLFCGVSRHPFTRTHVFGLATKKPIHLLLDTRQLKRVKLGPLECPRQSKQIIIKALMLRRFYLKV